MRRHAWNSTADRSRRIAAAEPPSRLESPRSGWDAIGTAAGYLLLLVGILAGGTILVVHLGTIALDRGDLAGVLLVWIGEIGLAAVAPSLARFGIELVRLPTDT